MYLLLKMVFFHGHASFQGCRATFPTTRHQVPETELRNIISILWDAGAKPEVFRDPTGPNWNISLDTVSHIDDRWSARFFYHFREPCVTSLNRVCLLWMKRKHVIACLTCETSWWQVGFHCASLSLRLGRSKQISRQMIQVIQKWRSFLLVLL